MPQQVSENCNVNKALISSILQAAVAHDHAAVCCPQPHHVIDAEIDSQAYVCQVSEAVSQLEKAIKKSHRSHTEAFARSVATHCLLNGFSLTDTGYAMEPVLLPDIKRAQLQTRACKRYFSIISGPQDSQLMVLAHLPKLIVQPHSPSVKSILSRLHTNTTYPTMASSNLISNQSVGPSSADTNLNTGSSSPATNRSTPDVSD